MTAGILCIADLEPQLDHVVDDYLFQLERELLFDFFLPEDGNKASD